MWGNDFVARLIGLLCSFFFIYYYWEIDSIYFDKAIVISQIIIFL